MDAPDFTLKELGGGNISLKELRGKIVILNFFTTW
jgi:peroxiredoxin